MKQVYEIKLYASQEAAEDNLPSVNSVWVEESDVGDVRAYAYSKGLFATPAKHVTGFIDSAEANAWVDKTAERLKVS